MNWFLYDNGPRHERVKSTLSGLRQFLATESPLKMMKNSFCFTLVFFFLKINQFLSWIFGHVKNDWKDKVNFKIYDVITTYVAQYLIK